MNSAQHLRRYKLLCSLDVVSKNHSKSSTKRKLSINTISNISVTDNLRKLNKNKKYMLEEERNTEIERGNRLLYEKITGHFQSLKNNIQNRHKWRKRKCKNHGLSDTSSNISQTVNEQLKYLSRVKFREERPEEVGSKTLFCGVHEIDGVMLHIKVTLDRQHYNLQAQNSVLQISLQMKTQDYLPLHHHELQGNPCNIFKFLQIDGNKIRFRTRANEVKQKEPYQYLRRQFHDQSF